MKVIKKISSFLLTAIAVSTMAICVRADILTTEIPSSNLFTTPTIVTEIDTEAELGALANTAPNTAIFAVNDEGQAVLADGTVVGTAAATVGICGDTIIPAFEVSSEAAVNAVIANLDENNVQDFFLVSDDPALLRIGLDNDIWARGVLRVGDSYRGDDGTYDLMAVRGDANASGCHVVILPEEASNRQNAYYLERRLIGVWTTAPQTEYGQMAAILSGSNGIVTKDVAAAKACLVDCFEKNTMTRQVLIIGHRGLPGTYPENTIEGSLLAVEAGADIVENDIYITKDNVLVIMHDADVSRTTNGNGNIEDYTLAQLKEFEVDTHSEYTGWKIPTLEEYFIEWKKLDTEKQLFVELKSAKPELVTEFVRLVKEYDIADQVSVISFSQEQLIRLHEEMPEMSIGFLTSGYVSDNISQSLKIIIRTVQKFESTFNQDYGNVTKQYFAQLNAHGITHWPWTYRDQNLMMQHFMMGLNGMTTDYANWVSETVKYCYVGEGLSDTELTLTEGETLEDVFHTMQYNGVSAPGGDIKIVSGGEHISVDGNTITAVSAGEAYVFASYTTKIITKPIRATSDLIKITITSQQVEEAPADTEEAPIETAEDTSSPAAEQSESSTGVVIAAAAAVVVVLAGGGAVVSRRIKK